MADRESARMRELLAAQGIELDEPRRPIARSEAKSSNAPVDRDAVRAALVAAGAPAHDLEWLVDSCPTIADAKSYRPPPRTAWCSRCDGPTLCDEHGCMSCRETQDVSP